MITHNAYHLVYRNERHPLRGGARFFSGVFKDFGKSPFARVFNAGINVAVFSRTTDKASGVAGPAERRMRYSPAHLAS